MDFSFSNKDGTVEKDRLSILLELFGSYILIFGAVITTKTGRVKKNEMNFFQIAFVKKTILKKENNTNH